MKWTWTGLIFAGMLGIIAFEPNPGFSQEDSAVVERVKRLEEENALLRDLVKDLKKRIDKLDGADSAKSDKKKDEEPTEGKKKKKKESEPGSDQSVSETDLKTETNAKDEVSKKDDSSQYVDENKEDKTKGSEWLPSLFGEEFRLGGRLQVEYFDPESESLLPSARTDYPGGTFHIDELSLNVDGDFKNNIRLYSRFDVTGEDEGLVEAYVDFQELPLSTELRVGLQKRFFRPSRFTETYPLPGIAFWRSRVLGLTLKGNYDPVYAYMSLVNGTQLDDRQLVEDKSAKMLSDNDSEYDLGGNEEFSGGLGIDLDFEQYGKLDILGFGLVGELSNEDITFLQNEVPGYGFFTSDRKELAGVNVDYGIGDFDFFAQAIGGRDGEMDRFSWYAELSYAFDIEGWKYLNSIRPLVRYGELDTNMTPQPFMRNGSLTWDRQQWLFAVISELVRNVNFRVEYALNEEDTGGPDANNNELLFQLEVRF